MSDTIPTTPSKRMFRLGTTFWVVVGSLLLLGGAFFAENFDRLTLLHYLYRLDFRHWFPSLATPLWLITAFLAFDAVTLRQPCVDAGLGRLRFESIVFAVKVFLAILIIYFTSYFFPRFFVFSYHRWFWWYPANLLLFILLLEEWTWIYKTRNRTDFTPEKLTVRKRFLVMSLVIAGELGIYNLIPPIGWLRRFPNALERWLGFGDYSHLAAFTFILVLLAVAITIFSIKEWLVAIRHVRKAKKTINNPQQSE